MRSCCEVSRTRTRTKYILTTEAAGARKSGGHGREQEGRHDVVGAGEARRLLRQPGRPPRRAGPAPQGRPLPAHRGGPQQQERPAAHAQPRPQDGPRAPPRRPLLPVDPLARATAGFWARFLEEECKKPLWIALWADGEAQAAAARETKERLTLLEAQLPEGKRFFGGDAIGFLDIAVGGAVAHWMGVFEEMAGVRLLTEETHPALCRWARAYRADETVRQCLPDRARVLAALAARKDLYVSIAKAMAAQK